MKRTQLLVLSALALGLQGVAQASPYPADAEAGYTVAALDTFADQQSRSGGWGVNERSAHSAFPSDAEASHSLLALRSYADQHAGDALGAMQAPTVIAFVNIDD